MAVTPDRNPKKYTSDQLCAMKVEEFLEYCKARFIKSKTGTIIVLEGLNCSYMGLEKIPDLSEAVIRGGFNCSHNRLKDLTGIPQTVRSFFDCSFNELTSLAGAPLQVGGYTSCKSNKLTSLKGAPAETYQMYCGDNPLMSLEGLPAKTKEGVVLDKKQLSALHDDYKRYSLDIPAVLVDACTEDDEIRLLPEDCQRLGAAMAEKKYQDSRQENLALLKNPFKFQHYP